LLACQQVGQEGPRCVPFSYELPAVFLLGWPGYGGDGVYSLAQIFLSRLGKDLCPQLPEAHLVRQGGIQERLAGIVHRERGGIEIL